MWHASMQSKTKQNGTNRWQTYNATLPGLGSEGNMLLMKRFKLSYKIF